jgi:predicted heme/steroid binding protein
MKHILRRIIPLTIIAVLLMVSAVFVPSSQAATDTISPVANVTSPTNNSSVSGTVSISATASDTSVTGSACVVTLFGLQYDVTQLRSTHSGGDMFNCGTDMTTLYQSTHSTNVTRMQPYLIPQAGIAKVEFYIDGVLKGSDTTSPYFYSWDTTTATNGSHTIQARAYDLAGLTGNSSIITAIVNNVQNPVPSVLTSINITPATASIAVGTTKQFNAIALDQYGVALNPQPIFAWNSATQGTATINVAGLATGVGAGTTNIIASSGGVASNIALLTVSAAAPVFTSISITPTSSSIMIGGTQQFSAVAKDQYGTALAVQPAFTWALATPATATISVSGLATGVAVGTANITAVSGGVTSNMATLTVTAVLTPAPIPTPTSLRIFTGNDLAAYDGTNPNLPIYIGLNGRVYDVTAGSQFYAVGGVYHYLVGRDSSAELNQIGGGIISNKYPVVGLLIPVNGWTHNTWKGFIKYLNNVRAGLGGREKYELNKLISNARHIGKKTEDKKEAHGKSMHKKIKSEKVVDISEREIDD